MTVEAEKPRTQDKMEFPTLQGVERKDGDMIASIKSLEEEELQLSELTEIEKVQVNEVAAHLKEIVASLDTPIHIEPSIFSEVILNPDGKIMLVSNGSSVATIPIEALPGAAMIPLLTQAVPEIKRILVERKTSTSDRASFLDKSAKEFRKVTNAIPNKSKGDSTQAGMAKKTAATSTTSAKERPQGRSPDAIDSAIP